VMLLQSFRNICAITRTITRTRIKKQTMASKRKFVADMTEQDSHNKRLRTSTKINAPKIKHITIAYENDNEKEGDLIYSLKDAALLKPRSPEHWQEVWTKIEDMRKKQPAPVDTMGCSVLADKTVDAKVFRYQVLISLMLSSQTKDEITSAAMKNLQKFGLTVENILKTPETEIDQLIKQVGFHTKKSFVHQENNSDTP